MRGGSNAGPRQLPLDLGHRAELSRENLIVSPANAAAVALVDRWPDWPAPVVILAGPTGSGKSHLAEIWAREANAVALSPVRLAEGLEPARQGRAILVDGIAAGAIDQTALFHLINEVRAAGGFLLLTSRSFPAAWGVTLPDLASRLRAATVVETGAPDDLLLAGVITKLFADRQVEVEAHVVAYLISRIERSLSTAGRVVDQLDRAALEQKSRVTRALASSVITALDQGQGELDF
ncbi:MAG: DnaA regulatory inactivator HdaA [Mesorhizobium sp.]